MDDRKYKKWTHRIDVLMKKKGKIKTYNLSGSAWQDYCTTNERSKLYSYNDAAEAKKQEIDQMISEILQMLKAEGYDTEKIMDKYNSKRDNKGER